ncbi:hypothetical protein CW706_04445 [Candidatus Bathyarchaeota archaeon]|nr:MAG: hypothetical protein CW706_04445 [Candidatus Bathyarchaeota archaeon]
MGFSVTVASAIILAGLIIFVGATVASLIYSINQLTVILNILSRKNPNINIELDLTCVNASYVEFYVRNTGSKTIFLKSQGFNWNSVIVAYKNITRHSYLIEDYEILEIKVQNSTLTFNPSTHSYLNPGEEAKIRANLPREAPKIPYNEPVIVVFISHYGVSAIDEGTRVS